MFSTGLFIFAGALALFGWTTAACGFMLSLQNRRRRSHYKEKQAVEFVVCGTVIIIRAAFLALGAF